MCNEFDTCGSGKLLVDELLFLGDIVIMEQKKFGECKCAGFNVGITEMVFNIHICGLLSFILGTLRTPVSKV
jgi:hypothetical protein